MTNNHAKRCLLAQQCKLAGTDACKPTCPHFIQLHGMSGTGGRAAAAGVPTDYAKVTMTNSPARASQPKAYGALDAYVKTFERQFDEDASRIKSLYLWSASPGTGKTTSAAAALNAWLTTHYLGSLKRDRKALQQPAYWLDVNELQTLYNKFNRSGIAREVAEKSSKEYYRRLASAEEAPFAVYDDIGVRSATEGYRADLHSSINARVASAKPTIYTSNLAMEELTHIFDARLYDRIRDMCAPIHFEGESKRGMRRN